MWRRREVLSTLATGAAGFLVAADRTDAAVPGSREDDPHHAAMLKSCGSVCGECNDACNKGFHHCIGQSARGKMPYAKMAQTLIDCTAFCALSAELISRGSAMMVISCQACADACRRCAQECETFDTDLDMKICLDACKRCEESCRHMVKTMAA